MIVTDTIEEGSHNDELLLRVVLRVVGREVVDAKMLQEVTPPRYMIIHLCYRMTEHMMRLASLNLCCCTSCARLDQDFCSYSGMTSYVGSDLDYSSLYVLRTSGSTRK